MTWRISYLSKASLRPGFKQAIINKFINYLYSPAGSNAKLLGDNLNGRDFTKLIGKTAEVMPMLKQPSGKGLNPAVP
jgi:hypothetical protein